MKRFLSVFLAFILLCSVYTANSFSLTANAAIPTAFTIYETKKAPNINDKGKIDSVYGTKLFDIKASEHPLDSGNLYPSEKDGRDGEKLSDPKVKAAIAKMRNVGYMTYDQENLYIACEVTDIVPKAASNNAEFWKSTNLQLTMFVNEELSFPTIAYERTNKVKVWGDDRSLLDYELVEATFTEKSQTNYVYEIKIPWVAFPEIEKAEDVRSFRIGMIQTSMANGYVCSAFGEAFFLDSAKCIPVTMKSEIDNIECCHKYTNKISKATLTKNGSIVKKCTVCGKNGGTTKINYPKTIKLSATSYVYNGKVKTPTVTVKDSAGKKLKKNTDYTVTYAKGRKNVGEYKVTIKFKGNYSGTKTLFFTVKPRAASINKLTAKKKSLTVKLNRSLKQSTGYQIQYATNKNFKSAKTKTVTNYKTTSVNLTKLTAKKTYYVRVRTYKKVGKTTYYSNWSTAKYKKTK